MCVPQRSQLFNRASKNRSVSGKPCLRDHLSITTIFPCTVEWSLKTGFTVYIANDESPSQHVTVGLAEARPNNVRAGGLF